MMDVARPEQPGREQERRDALMHLGVWEVTNPGARVTQI
jgi:hypothetical protein